MTPKSRKSPVKAVAVGPVASVEKVGPTYAKGLHHLAGIGSGVRQGEPFDGMRLDFELSCGTAALHIDGCEFGVSLLNCHVGLDRKNCEVRPYTRYEHRLVKGSFEVRGTETLDSGRHVAVGVEADVGLSGNPIVGPAGALGRLKGRLGWGRDRKERRQEMVRRQPRVDLVATFGHDRWRVGDARLGDARRGDGKLAGTYFTEERDGDGEPKPLCVLSRINATLGVEVSVSVSAAATQVVIERANRSATAAESDEVEKLMRQKSGQAQRKHATVQADLRGRIAGLALGKALGEAQKESGLCVRDGEFLIARQTLYMPASSGTPPSDREVE